MKKQKTILGLITALIFALILSGCGNQKINQLSDSETFSISFTDDEGRKINLNEPCTRIISSPTFRYYKGVRELARFMYPEEMDNYDALRRSSKSRYYIGRLQLSKQP